jgi:uncharacterized protein YndB with AHSA1/START domain
MTGKMGRRTDSATRIVHAAPEAVYAAFAEGRRLMAWLPPAGMTGRALDYAFEEGGSYGIELRYRDDRASGKTTRGTDVTRGRFVELVPGRRIRQTVIFDSDRAEFAGEMVMTWTFDPAPEGTSVTVTAENVPPGITEADHRAGMTSSLENLARFVEAG